jgi:putative hydrolase of the HAD superfamily
MSVNAIVFDLDDTLYKEKDYVFSGLKAIDKWMIDKFQITNFFATAASLFNSGEKTFIFNKTLDKLHVEYSDKIIKNMVDQYRSHKPDIHLLEDAKWVFEHLLETVKIGLISDGFFISQKQKVEALRLKERFHTIILSDSLGRKHWKPSHVPYEQASKELQLPPHQCCYIGDNAQKDFITAKRLGWITVQIERMNGIYSGIEVGVEHQAHYQIDDLRKLAHIPELKQLFLKKYETLK